MPKDKINNEEVIEALAKIGEPDPEPYVGGTALYDQSHWQISGKTIAKQFAAMIDIDYMRGTISYGQELEGPRQEEK